ncbi:MAG: rhomboid family intramembrane serine protease, partial [Sphingomonadales bacterium]|nr:rhomboid family intramembrane serine protease [Sphingomonadales bacterium]
SGVLWLIAALCILPELALHLSGNPGFLRGKLLQNFAFWPGLLGGGWAPNYPLQQGAMFVTYGFLHAGLWHLGFNMVTLVSLGRPLLDDLGARRFTLLYALGLIGGGVGYAIFASKPLPMVGASGALFGLAGALVWQHFAEDWRERPHAEALRAAIRPVALLIGLNVVMFEVMQGQLAWETHLGGFLAGAAAMAVMLRGARTRPQETPADSD